MSASTPAGVPQPAASTAPLASGPVTYYTAGEGRPVLHLHPAGGLHWGGVHAALALTHHVFAPVAPGFDGTPEHAGVDSIAGLGLLAANFIERVVGGPCDVIGHSFGGWIAASLAAQRPDLVGQLVLSASAGFRPPGTPPIPADPEARKRALFRHPEKLGPGKGTVIETTNQQRYARYHGGMGMDADLLERLRAFDHLTLLIHGSHDGVIPERSSQLLRATLPRSYLVYLWDAGHALEVDQPERTARLVGEFLQRSEAFLVNWGAAG